jgi:hypothetical protein
MKNRRSERLPKSKKRDEALSPLPLAEQGERGRYYEALQQGHSVRIHEDDGTTTVHYYQIEEGAVLLDPDVREYFPDAKAVNAALRSLIALIPSQRIRRRRKVDTNEAAQ